MIKRKWYERVSAAALAAMLFMNSGGMGVQSRAEILSGENGVVIQEAEGEAQPEANEEEQGLQEEKLANNEENGENDPEEENPVLLPIETDEEWKLIEGILTSLTNSEDDKKAE